MIKVKSLKNISLSLAVGLGITFVIHSYNSNEWEGEAFSAPVEFPTFEEATLYTMTIRGAGGGAIMPHLKTAHALLRSATMVIVDGPCPSSCAAAMELVRENMCFTKKAIFGFHQSVQFNEQGEPVFLPMSGYFRPEINEWVDQNGGWPIPLYEGTTLIDPNLLWMRPNDLAKFYKPCGAES